MKTKKDRRTFEKYGGLLNFCSIVNFRPHAAIYFPAQLLLHHLADIGGLHVMHSAEPPKHGGAHVHFCFLMILKAIIRYICKIAKVNMDRK